MFEYSVKVLKVIDGDTLDVMIDLGFDIFTNQRVRLAGIDTPESRTTDVKEKKLGMESKEYLKNKIDQAKNIMIQTCKGDPNEKYGRILARVFLDTECINDSLVENGYAWKYDGAAKIKNFDELLAKRNKI